MWTLSGGGGYTDASNASYAIDSPENAATMTWLRDNLVSAGLTGPVDPAKLDRGAAFAAFDKGEVGMLNGHPTLLHDAERAGIKVGMVQIPGKDGPSKSSMGVADWIMGFKQNHHATQIGTFLDFVFTDKNVMDFVGQYDLLPTTYSANDVMSEDPKYKDLAKFQTALPTSQLPPVDKTSWGPVSESIKKNIGRAVQPGSDPSEVLDRIAGDAAAAENAE